MILLWTQELRVDYDWLSISRAGFDFLPCALFDFFLWHTIESVLSPHTVEAFFTGVLFDNLNLPVDTDKQAD
jgi:hypothetical protein